MSLPEAGIRVLIADDSPVVRKFVSDALLEDDRIAMCVEAKDGAEVLSIVDSHRPDVIVLDLAMPGMDGLETLVRLRGRGDMPPVVVFSASAERGAQVTIRALLGGASDYVTKPSARAGEDSKTHVLEELLPRVIALASGAGTIRKRREDRSSAAIVSPLQHSRPKIRLIAIGASTGGPEALVRYLDGLPRPLCVPVLIVQHLPSHFTRALVANLSQLTGLVVHEAYPGAELATPEIWLAPGDRHLVVRNRDELDLDDGSPIGSHRPSVDLLFRSVAAQWGSRGLGVLLSGMGSDGLAGGRELVAAGGSLIGQSEDSSVVWGMPGAAAQAGLTRFLGSPEELATWTTAVLDSQSHRSAVEHLEPTA